MMIMFILLSTALVSATDDVDMLTADNTADLSTDMEDNVLNDNDNSNLIEKTNDEKNIDDDTLTNDKYVTDKNDSLKAASKKIEPTIRLSDYSIYRNQTSTFYARIMDENATGTAIFKINGITISDKLNVQNGIASTDFTIPVNWGLQTHTLTFVYAGNDVYKEARVNSTLTLEYDSDRLDPNLKSSNYEKKYNQTVRLEVSLNKSATGKVAFKLRNKTIAIVNVENGGAYYDFELKSITPNRYRLSVVYSGDWQFSEKRLNYNLTVTKIDTKITTKNVTSKAGAQTIFEARVRDEYGNNVTKTNVSFKLNAGSIGVAETDENGIAILNITTDYRLDKTNYTIKVVVGENAIRNANQSTAVLTMKQLKTKTEVSNINAKPGDKVTLSTSVADENGNPVLNGYVTVYVNNKKYAQINVQNGFARTSYTLPANMAGNLELKSVYTGTWKYANSNSTGTLAITKLATRTLAGNVLTKPGFASEFNANVTDQNQKNVNEGVVVFRLNGKVIGNATVKNGQAILKYTDPLTAAGKYRINANYMGTDLYKESADENIYNVSQLKTVMSGYNFSTVVGKTVTLKVNLVDESRYVVNNGTVRFYVNNTYIGNASVVKGVAQINFTPSLKYESKQVRYTANYTKNDYYMNSTTYGNLTITKQLEVYVSPNGNDNNFGNKTHPFKTIQHAINHVALLGTINLAKGTYKENNILVNNSVRIVGTGVNDCIIDGSSSRMIFNASIEKYSLELQKVCLQNGKSSIANTAGAIYSAGMLITNGVKFQNNVATGASSAGAIYSIGALNITGTTFTNNTLTAPTAEGAAIRTINNNTTVVASTFIDNTAKGNTAAGGGAIYAQRVSLIIMNTTFNKNSATARNVTGGTIKVVNSTASIYNVRLLNSNANATENAMGGSICDLSSNMEMNNVTVQNSLIDAKSIASGGVIYLESAQMEIINSKFLNSRLKAENAMGGVISTYYGLTTIRGSDFELTNIVSTTNSYGGVIYHTLGTLYSMYSVFNNTVSKASTIYGGSIYFSGTTLKLNHTNITKSVVNATATGLAGALYSEANAEINASNFIDNKVSGKSVGGGAIASLGNLVITQTNFESNNASNVGNAITGVQKLITINGNYWGSASPNWKTELKGITEPSSYSKTKIKN
jgi:predicted outer membrane repeat protein